MREKRDMGGYSTIVVLELGIGGLESDEKLLFRVKGALTIRFFTTRTV
jgi:hypothetical protein